MCGIFGCLSVNASAKVLEALRKLEYRGYDSAGLAALFPERDGPIETQRTTGYVSNLVSKVNGKFDGSHISIGHTRWATHGEVSEKNAHPHSNKDGSITVVHNGIIENANALTDFVLSRGYHMKSETDSEVIVHLIDYELRKNAEEKNYSDAFVRAISRLEGSWAIASMISGMEGILVSRNGAPMVIGRGADNYSISSDILPFYGLCSEIAHMSDGDNFLITNDGIEAISGIEAPSFEVLEGIYDEEDPGNFPNMMSKEIHDQPIALSNAINGRISPDGTRSRLSGFKLDPIEIKKMKRINLVACGTAYFAARLGAVYIRRMTSITVEAFHSSEFPAEFVCGNNTLTIGITQSGETIDTLNALQLAKSKGGEVSSICNVIGSTISRLTGNGAYLYAGPEFSVASTKAFSNMVAVLLLFAMSISDLPERKIKSIAQQLRQVPSSVESQLSRAEGSLIEAVRILGASDRAIFIGRGLSEALAYEGALKMMEVTYLPCLAYPGGELKHGAIALIEESTPIIAIAPSDETLPLMESSVRECKARGAKIIVITDNQGPITKFADVVIPSVFPGVETSIFTNIVPLQFLALNLAIAKGRNVDRPRNLAKSVTVV